MGGLYPLQQPHFRANLTMAANTLYSTRNIYLSICYGKILRNPICHVLTVTTQGTIAFITGHMWQCDGAQTVMSIRPPSSPKCTTTFRLKWNHCRAGSSWCQPPCFRWIDNGCWAHSRGRNQKSCNRKHTVTARPLKGWRRTWKDGRVTKGFIVRNATEKVLYFVTGWWMVEQGGQDQTCAHCHLAGPSASAAWEWGVEDARVGWAGMETWVSFLLTFTRPKKTLWSRR